LPGDASSDVELCREVMLASVQRDRVQSTVELAVDAAAEPMADRLAARGGDGRDAGEAGESCFGADAAVV
jgi:predicted kinase